MRPSPVVVVLVVALAGVLLGHLHARAQTPKKPRFEQRCWEYRLGTLDAHVQNQTDEGWELIAITSPVVVSGGGGAGGYVGPVASNTTLVACYRRGG